MRRTTPIPQPRDVEKQLQKLLRDAPSPGEAIALHRLMMFLRRDGHPPGGEVEQAALRILFDRRPALKTVRYHKLRQRAPGLNALLEASMLVERALENKRVTIQEALNIAFQKLS